MAGRRVEEIKGGIRQKWIDLQMAKCTGEGSKDSLSNNKHEDHTLLYTRMEKN